MKWEVTFPAGVNGGQLIRGGIPFFCHDVTERKVRVPMSAASTAHPCGAKGVKELNVLVQSTERLDELSETYSRIFGTEGVRSNGRAVFEISRVKGIDGITDGPKIVLRTPENAQEQANVKERGFWFGDVVLVGQALEGKEAGKRERLDGGENDVGGLWIEYV